MMKFNKKGDIYLSPIQFSKRELKYLKEKIKNSRNIDKKTKQTILNKIKELREEDKQ